jgi:hypothetical protein
VKFFGKINFPFAQKEQAEECFFDALKAVSNSGGEQAEKASHFLDTFDSQMNSVPVLRFWDNVALQNEKAKTRHSKLLLAEKKVNIHI